MTGWRKLIWTEHAAWIRYTVTLGIVGLTLFLSLRLPPMEGRNTLLERATTLAKAYNTKEHELSQAQETIKALTDKVAFIEEQVRSSTQGVEKHIEELNESLRREKVERAVVEGALEAARKDFSRLMREVMALEQQKNAREGLPELRSANAA